MPLEDKSTTNADHRPKVMGDLLASCPFCPIRNTGVCSAVPKGLTSALENAKTDERFYHEHEMVLSQGFINTRLLQVVSGWLLIQHHDAEGNRTVLDVVVPGEIIGVPILNPQRLSYSAETLTTAVICATDHERLKAMASDIPDFNSMLIQSVSTTLERWYSRIVTASNGHAMARVAAFLEDVDRRANTPELGTHFRYLPLRQLDIANATGLTGPYVNKLLKTMARQHILSLRRGHIKIENRKELKRLTWTKD